MTDFDYLSLATTIVVVAEIAGLILAADAIMRPRSPQGAIAWCIALITLPLMTVPFYLIFGRTRFEGYAEAVREKETRLGEALADWLGGIAAESAEPLAHYEEVETIVRNLSKLAFIKGNRVRLLIDGPATYKAMLDAIDEAHAYVLVQFYIVEDDGIGRVFRDALIKAARRGLRVYFLYDEIGCFSLPAAYLKYLTDAGAQVSGSKTTQGFRNRFQINFRNHRKLLVVDGEHGFIGGLNLGDAYLKYRDTHLSIEGPAVQLIQFSFAKDWYWGNQTIPEINKTALRFALENQAVAIVNTGPADLKPNCSVLFATLIHSARRRLWITSPYFVPDAVMERALQVAAIRGVDVRIILPEKADHRFVELASTTYFAAMCHCGVRLFRYHDGFLHQKVILVDEALAGIGTVNFDRRSMHLNFEDTALIADLGFVKEVEAMLLEDLKKCSAIDPKDFDDKSASFRLAARIARLASPLL